MASVNPFALVKASDYTDEQINSLWVEMGVSVIDKVIEPRSPISKMILGGKGTGKTHLLRYHSYSAARLRTPQRSGLSILEEQGFLSVFVRANGLDAARFHFSDGDPKRWQKAFSLYFELRLVEAILDALCDVRDTSPEDMFKDDLFTKEVGKLVTDPEVGALPSISKLRDWVISRRKRIDSAVNNSAFTGSLDIEVPFSMGALCLNIGLCVDRWCPRLSGLSIIYMIDEIENFSESQQEIVNTLIRYGEGRTTFRVGGRLYSIRTLATLPSGEANKEGSEFKTVVLDNLLGTYKEYPEFSKKFVIKRLVAAGVLSADGDKQALNFDPKSILSEVDGSDFYASFIEEIAASGAGIDVTGAFNEALAGGVRAGFFGDKEASEIIFLLTDGFPPLIQKLNCLIFCKSGRRGGGGGSVAASIRSDALALLGGGARGPYTVALDHYRADLLAQVCRDIGKPRLVPYAGFPSIIKMSSGNPRSLLILLGRIYSIASFRGLDFSLGSKLSIELQTVAAIESAHFAFDQDTHFGSQSDGAREPVARLASLLRTARYSLNIPEVSPLTVSFADDDLSDASRIALISALNFSYVFEVASGRPDRNSKRLNRKIQLNPLLSPKWGLPISRRGDISLPKDILNAMLDPLKGDEFDYLLKRLNARWNNPFTRQAAEDGQEELFR